ncbi:hypothetical protein [Oceanobacillus halophilus]|uniref:Uncharacterized protein n=1 Tax=Oceanobacillus halophilus TaxID=930130 RepID=A0A495A8D5_9BACI|nr:hypothetical protein [Oceanobacillus halophilus]RKQ34705.1 hypothetical protein D8M06_07235 [Oceanobacillus halophilus]
MDYNQRDHYYIAHNAEELLCALITKEDYIIIHENFKKEFEENTQLPVTETEEMAFQLGSRGWAGILGELFFHIINFFSKGTKQQKKIDSRIRKYNLKQVNDKEILLYLRQLNY